MVDSWNRFHWVSPPIAGKYVSGFMNTRIGVLGEMIENITEFSADAAEMDVHVPYEDGGMASASEERYCAFGNVDVSDSVAAALGNDVTVEDNETTVAAKRLRLGRYGYRICKRTFDIVFSTSVLLCLSWLYLIIAIAIKIDDPEGPVIFAQTRVGRDGREFRMYKFRSMVADAEARLPQLLEDNEKTGPVFKLHDDPRVTRVGRVLRKVSLDELPQFLNVLKGDLSVVGPRPALPREVAEYTPRQRQRLLVNQGLTCYWQTRRDRDSITFDKWVELDLLYIRKCSAWTDFKLIVQTVGCVLTAQGN